MLVFMIKLTKDSIENGQYESERKKLESIAFNYKNIGFKTQTQKWEKMKQNFIFTEQVRVKGTSIKNNIL